MGMLETSLYCGISGRLLNERRLNEMFDPYEGVLLVIGGWPLTVEPLADLIRAVAACTERG